jgi:hypothetical protein
MASIPGDLQHLLLTGFDVTGSSLDPALSGLALRCAAGEARFVVNRKQLLDIAKACLAAAEAMPAPS